MAEARRSLHLEKLQQDFKLWDRMRLDVDITTPLPQTWIATTAEMTAVVAEMSREARNQDTVRLPLSRTPTSILLTCIQSVNDLVHHTTNGAMTDDALDHHLEVAAMLLHNVTTAPATDQDLITTTRAVAGARARQSLAARVVATRLATTTPTASIPKQADIHRRSQKLSRATFKWAMVMKTRTRKPRWRA